MNTPPMSLGCVLNAAEGQLDIILYEFPQVHTSETTPYTPSHSGVSESHTGNSHAYLSTPCPQMLCAQQWHAPTKGAELLTPALQSLCALQKIALKDICHFACVHGPGSFTGIRLTMGTVAAIRRITGAHNASIDYMQALALTGALAISPLFAQKKLHFCVLTHAKRHVVHCQYFTCAISQESPSSWHSFPQAHSPAFLCAPQDIFTQLPPAMRKEEEKNTPIFLLGSGLVRHEEILTPLIQDQRQIFQDISENPSLATSPFMLPIEHPSPAALCLLASTASYHQQDIDPLYVRPCDAVENLSHIAQKQGMDADKAHARLAEILRSTPRESM